MKTVILQGGTLASIALSLALVACASQRAADGRAATATATNTTSDGKSSSAAIERETTIRISDDVRERCNVQDVPAAAPGFDYDQATLPAGGRNVLDDVATCLREGPLSGQAITLVGRADSRGSEGYNDTLGANRAAAARDYLTQRGVSAERIHLASRGEHGARGNDEASRALDRRVDIELGDVRNHPIIEGTMKQVETSRARAPVHPEAASYADTAEGGKPVGDSGAGVSSESTPSGQIQGSASGSVKAGGSK